ncbi:type II secretion system protein E [Gordonibacter sp. An230]|uniref:CpaF family protein n=1 Tax=Gordonibacter sp. An230 TaxID=1965592 RepID=UPI000B3A241A|nr:ATPase, T2SS/T4P/T4SS family [Gordonibacter sp. An230]OUO92117.1 type II secretion system protein E [Gordonibacter sp. An230]
MDRSVERALKTVVREEVALRLRSQQAGPSAVETLVRDVVGQVAFDRGVPLSPYDLEPLAKGIVDDFLRYGPLQPLLDDPSVTEIMVNGGGVDEADPELPFRAPVVYVERAGLIERRPDIVFDDAEHLRRIINKIAEQAGMRCDETHAMGCAMLPGGRARATYVVPPIAPDGPALNVRTFSEGMLSMRDLLSVGALPAAMADFLCAAVQARCPIVISGGTGSGKTTLLGALSGFIPEGERVITIEDTPELRLQASHVERMQTREANVEGEGAVGMRELVALSLRRRPDRIIVGECRGAEAYDMLQAMQTDHPGSMTTIHANDPSNALSRLRTMVGYADGDLSREVIAQQIAESLQGGLVVHVERMRDGTRKVTSVVSVDPLPEGSTVIPRAELFAYDIEGVDANGWVVGAWRPCGVQPQAVKERMRAAGVPFDPAWFFGS